MTFIQTQKVDGKLRTRRRSGAVVVEMALVLMLLLYIAFGLVEFGYYLYVRDCFEGAAREGARVAIVTGNSNSTVTTAVGNFLSSCGLSNSGYTTTIQSPSGTSCNVSTVTTGSSVYVTVSTSWGTAGAGFSPLQLMPKTKTLQGVSVFDHE